MTRQSLPQPDISQAQILDTVTAICDTAAAGGELEVLLQQAVDRLRPLLDTDRVVVYQVLSPHDGFVIAESVNAPWQPLRGERISESCFANGWEERDRRGQLSLVADVQQGTLAPCYADLLSRLQVQAILAVPIFAGYHLWGLLIAHHCRSPRSWNLSSRNLLVHVARHLGQGVYQHGLQQQLQASSVRGQTEQLFDLFTHHVEQVLFIRDAVSGQFLYVSAAYERIWDHDPGLLYSNPSLWLRQVHPDDLSRVQASLGRQFDGNSVRREYRIVRPNGDVRWVQAHVQVVNDDQNQPRYMVGWAEDCTERRQLQASLRATEAALSRRVGQEQLLRMLTARMRESLDLETILGATVAGIKTVFNADRAVIFQILANGDRRIAQQATSPDYATITDSLIPTGPLPAAYLERLYTWQPYIVNDIPAEPWSPDVTAFLLAIKVKSAMIAPIAHPFGGDSRSVREPTRNEYPSQNCQPLWGILVVHACGEHRQWQPFEANMLQHFADQLNTALHQAELYRQLQAVNEELDRISKVDSLTQLANRRWLDEYLKQEWQRLARERKPLSVVLADVDYFKPYNDTYGHAAGDQCLVEIASAIRFGVRRPADLAARYGGEEFALVLPDTDVAGAIRVVQLVRHHLQTLDLTHGASPSGDTITLSFGIATVTPTPDSPAEAILELADQALYAAKDAGRNQYQVFRPRY
ncbi:MULTISPECIES: diguanylate cyclase [Cyanophyceae]|uniref:diguanylate cyclase domain-containing protein n=1 Tax=Cyanophyceae TaxID=3028117 RepID=UPI001688C7FC|nr:MULTISPECIES: diguanylate cyclase [Cyanophyceae]MBD1916286.1 diguanylate cyclase [Phormidium sp. FACHB-77]MBD2028412.1 diguanylate cyclase [Phormidium sp. FACHB-322]MBD2051891.1 diguanylate cyclase [Leptolyngbya sp. FACHB-60]